MNSIAELKEPLDSAEPTPPLGMPLGALMPNLPVEYRKEAPASPWLEKTTMT